MASTAAASGDINLKVHYNQLWQHALRQFQQGLYELDPFLASAPDDRFGLTLLFRPGGEVKAAVEKMLQELRRIEPAQYYYPPSDLHVTVMSVISCHPGFRLEHIVLEDYVAVLRECMADIGSFEVAFRGITASPSCVMLQGFPSGEPLHALRDQLRQRFRKTGLQQSIDSRYVLQTAHCTVARLRNPPQHAPAFLDALQQFRGHSFGSTQVEQVELVYNDWYQRSEMVRQLEVFRLK